MTTYQNRVVISDLNNGDRVKVIYNGNVQSCFLIPKGEQAGDTNIKFSGKSKKAIDVPVATKENSIRITYKALRRMVIDGHKVFAKNGASIPCTQRAEKTPNKEVNVVVTDHGKIKHFNII